MRDSEMWEYDQERMTVAVSVGVAKIVICFCFIKYPQVLSQGYGDSRDTNRQCQMAPQLGMQRCFRINASYVLMGTG